MTEPASLAARKAALDLEIAVADGPALAKALEIVSAPAFVEAVTALAALELVGVGRQGVKAILLGLSRGEALLRQAQSLGDRLVAADKGEG